MILFRGIQVNKICMVLRKPLVEQFIWQKISFWKFSNRPQTVQIRKVNVIRKLWRVSKHIENESPVHLAFYCDILILSQIAFVQLFSEWQFDILKRCQKWTQKMLGNGSVLNSILPSGDSLLLKLYNRFECVYRKQ